jgi:predicted RNA-binding Zn ribbon-like protein
METPQLLLVGGRLCLDFCNTLEYRQQETPIDLLTNGYRSLVRWSEYVGSIDAEQVGALRELPAEAAEHFFRSAKELREAVYQLFKARMDNNVLPQDALHTLNRWHQQAMGERMLYFDDDLRWGWKDRLKPEIMLYEIALSAAQSLTEDDMTRIRQCPGCSWLFYDQSRNNSRTWCDMRFCGNRAKNKRFHERQKSEGE